MPSKNKKKSGKARFRGKARVVADAAPIDDIEPQRGKPYPIAGIGASAGGFEAFQQLLRNLPPDTGMALVLVQHLDPGHESMLTKLLSRATEMPVTEVKDGMEVEPNHVYVIPPNTTMAILGGILHLMARGEPGKKHMPIDFFLRSLAYDQGSRAIGVILSGTASDGTMGLKAIKAEGGITFAQDEKSAKYDGMPRSAIAAGCVDFVLPPEGIARELAHIGRHPYLGIAPPAKASVLPPEGDDNLRKIFILLRNATGVDFTYYRYTTIRRRIARRMVVHKMESLKQYVRYLQQNRAELEALYQDILIHVTGFFREPESFDVLKQDIFPKIMNEKPPGEPVRIWVPGCSTGEEAYSLAISLLEYLGERATGTPIQIFGTDISEAAITRARHGIYTESSVADVKPERLRRFFVKVDGNYQINKSVREMCIFARQDLTKDPPFSRLDLISCRNVLIYMGPVLQKKVMATFHYALKPTGFLILGKSESISGFVDLFGVVDRTNKIYSRKSTDVRLHFELTATEYDEHTTEKMKGAESPSRFDVQKEADRIILNRYSPAGLILNENMQILHFRGDCSPYLAPSPGEASLNLLKMARPELAVDLRTAVHRAKKEDAPIRKEGIRLRRNGQVWDVRLDVIPLAGPKERYFLVLFEASPAPDSAQAKPLDKTKVDKAHRAEMERLQRELQTTREYLQSIIEEQEATNEELKSANEEVLSSNEELQSTNEELETAKEELQSTNEELVTVNEQLQNRNAELTRMSDDLSNLLSGVSIPIVMLGIDRDIRKFTPPADRLLNLRPSDVGRPIDNIRPNINVPDLPELIRDVLDTVSPREREVQDADGHWYSMRIRPYRTTDNRIDGVVMVFVDIDELKRSRDELREQSEFSSALLDTQNALVTVVDSEGRFARFNRACEQISGRLFEEVKGKHPWDLLIPPDEVDRVKATYRDMLNGNNSQSENHWVAKDGSKRLISWSSAALLGEDGSVKYVIRTGIDITEQRRTEEALREYQAALENSRQQLRALTEGLLTAQEEERGRLARELHDDLSQELSRLAVEAEALEQKAPAEVQDFRRRLRSFRDTVARLLENVRRTAYQLHPSAIEHLGLAPALKAYCDEFSKQEGIRVRFTHRGLSDQIAPAVALCIYRVVQEALRNVARHSGARTAQVSAVLGEDGLLLHISDTGRGFDPAAPPGVGLGLVSMKERVRLAGGTLSLETSPGKGVRIDVQIPSSKLSRKSKKPQKS